VVFRQADIKFVLQATLQRRSERRYQELIADGENVQITEVMDNLSARDQVDAKQWEPLLRSAGVVVIDTTQMTIVDVVDRMEQCLRALSNRQAPA